MDGHELVSEILSLGFVKSQKVTFYETVTTF